jgi:hypothetical protein
MSFFIYFKMHTLPGRKRPPIIQTQSGTLSHLELNVARNTKDDLNFVEACLQRMLQNEYSNKQLYFQTRYQKDC